MLPSCQPMRYCPTTLAKHTTHTHTHTRTHIHSLRVFLAQPPLSGQKGAASHVSAQVASVCALIQRWCAPCVRRESQAEGKEEKVTQSRLFPHHCRTVPFPAFHPPPPFFWSLADISVDFVSLVDACSRPGARPPSLLPPHHHQQQELGSHLHVLIGWAATVVWALGNRECGDVALCL